MGTELTPTLPLTTLYHHGHHDGHVGEFAILKAIGDAQSKSCEAAGEAKAAKHEVVAETNLRIQLAKDAIEDKMLAQAAEDRRIQADAEKERRAEHIRVLNKICASERRTMAKLNKIENQALRDRLSNSEKENEIMRSQLTMQNTVAATAASLVKELTCAGVISACGGCGGETAKK